VLIAVAGTTIVEVDTSATAVTGHLTVSGNTTTAGTKSFEIPGENVGLPQGSKLRHCCIESPFPDLHYRMLIDAPVGESEWALPEYFEALNSQPQVWAAPFESFGTAWGNVIGNTLHLFAQTASKFNVLVIGRRSDPAVQGYTPYTPA
jgi:hypothetical protein